MLPLKLGQDAAASWAEILNGLLNSFLGNTVWETPVLDEFNSKNSLKEGISPEMRLLSSSSVSEKRGAQPRVREGPPHNEPLDYTKRRLAHWRQRILTHT